MPYLQVLLTAAKQTVNLGEGLLGAGHLRLISYFGDGLVAAFPLWVRVGNQPTTKIWSSFQHSAFPLLFDQTPAQAVFLNTPMCISEGDNLWNDSKLLDFEVVDQLQNPATFTNLMLVFDVVPPNPYWEGRKPGVLTMASNAHPTYPPVDVQARYPNPYVQGTELSEKWERNQGEYGWPLTQKRHPIGNFF